MTTEKNKTQVVKFETPEMGAIEPSKARIIKDAFNPMVIMLDEFEQKYNEVIKEKAGGITPVLVAKAKRIRLDIGKVRVATGKLKDKQKEYIKLEDKAIMSVHNLLVWAVTEKEDKLKEIEDHFIIQEKNRLEKLQSDRAEKLSLYLEDAHERKLSDMDEDVWLAYFGAKKKEHEDKIEAARIVENERIETDRKKSLHIKRLSEIKHLAQFFDIGTFLGDMVEIEWTEFVSKIEASKVAYDTEQERVKKENERLKLEAEKAEKDRLETEKVAKKEREELEAKNKLEREKAAKEVEKQLREKQALQRKLDAENKLKEDAENKRIADEKAAKLEAEKAEKDPIKTKLKLWVNGFDITAPPEANKTTSEIVAKFDAYKKWAVQQIENI